MRSMPRGAKEEKRSDVPTYLLFLRFFEIFRSDFRNIFLWCFWAPHAEKRPKTRLKKNRWVKTTGKKNLKLFRPKVSDMDFPQKVFNGVFELPLLRNAQKRYKTNLQKQNQKKRERYPPTPFSGHLPDIRRFQKKHFGAP
jgi:hypothetical protein